MDRSIMSILTGGQPHLEPEVLKIASMSTQNCEQVISIDESNNHLRLSGVERSPEDLIVDTMAMLGWSGEQMEELLKLRFPSAFEPNVGDLLGDIGSLSG